MVRETVAIETLARSATVRISMRMGFFLAARADLVFFVAMGGGIENAFTAYAAICRNQETNLVPGINIDGAVSLFSEKVYQSDPSIGSSEVAADHLLLA